MHIRQRTVHELNRHGTLANRRGHAFQAFGPDIAHREYPRQAGLQQESTSA